MSVRVRTTVAAVVAMAIAVAIGAFGLLVLQRKELVGHLDDVADVRAAGVASLVEQGTLPRTLDVSNDDDSLVRVVRRSDGGVLAESPSFRDAWAGARRPTGTDSVVTQIGSVRVTVLPVRGDLVYVATRLEPVDDAIDSLARKLAVGGPLLVALVGVVTWLVVGRALRPVEAIRREVASISGGSLDRRVPVPGSDDEIGRLAGTMNDMLDRVEHAVVRQQRFVADASHELQTPLTAMRAELEVAPSDGDWSRAVGAALDENARMERLVRDLLFLARTDAQPPAAPRLFDLEAVVLEEVARTRAPIDTSAVSHAEVLGRRDDLRRVVTNLLDNAQRHATSRVSISVRMTDDGAELAVTDDGPGVAPEDRERIFERFARLDDARPRATGGTGLGLAIAKEIIEQHGGTIRVDDAAPGARFVVAFPTTT